jgi:uncharacterized protein YjcR
MARRKQDDPVNNHEEAKRLFIEEGLSVSDIAVKINVSVQTVYKYKSSDMENGEDWDRQKKVWSMSPTEISNLYAYSLKRLLIKVDSDPKMLLNPATADAIISSV